jgi:hypothetical protein
MVSAILREFLIAMTYQSPLSQLPPRMNIQGTRFLIFDLGFSIFNLESREARRA